MASTEEQDALMGQCGMTAEQWAAAKAQVKRIRARGHRPQGTAKSLDEWGSVGDQLGLFDPKESR